MLLKNGSTKTTISLVVFVACFLMTIDVNAKTGFQRIRTSRSATGKDTCITPSSKSGSCIPAIRCRTYWARKKQPDLTNHTCGEDTFSKVCCPLMDGDETTVTKPPSTNVTPPIGLNDSTASPPGLTNSPIKVRRTRQSAFPTECGRSGAILTRIIGGQEAVPGAWPWMAVVYYVRGETRSPECGGALITTRHVATAAHCTVTTRRGTTFDPSLLLVRLGEHNIESNQDSSNAIDVNVRTIIKHESFSLRTFQNDIALLELTQTVQFTSRISPICIPFNTFSRDEELVDRNAIVIGWGSTRFGGDTSPTLQEVQLRIWDNELCREVFRRDVPITSVSLCAGDGDKDACRGDSGGPLMLADSSGNFHLIGIVSFGKRCAEPGTPGVYTRVTAFVNWIQENVG